jgi:hypothetical protein
MLPDKTIITIAPGAFLLMGLYFETKQAENALFYSAAFLHRYGTEVDQRGHNGKKELAYTYLY